MHCQPTQPQPSEQGQSPPQSIAALAIFGMIENIIAVAKHKLNIIKANYFDHKYLSATISTLSLVPLGMWAFIWRWR